MSRRSILEEPDDRHIDSPGSLTQPRHDGGVEPERLGTHGAESRRFFLNRPQAAVIFQIGGISPHVLKKAFRSTVQLKPICCLLGIWSGKTWSLSSDGDQGSPTTCPVCSEKPPTLADSQPNTQVSWSRFWTHVTRFLRTNDLLKARKCG